MFGNHFSIGSLMERSTRLIGNGQAPAPKYWKRLLQMIHFGELDPTIILTTASGWATRQTCISGSASDGIVRIFIETRFSVPKARGTPELARLRGGAIRIMYILFSS